MTVAQSSAFASEFPGVVRIALLWTTIAAGLVFTPFLVLAIRHATLGRNSHSVRRSVRRTTTPIDPWTEAARRLQTAPGHPRIDDTVDFDPTDPDETRW